MTFPLFLLIPALKLVGGIIQAMTQSRPADAPAVVVGGGQALVEFQPMLQQMLGAQMIAQATPQSPTPFGPSPEGESVSPPASGLTPYSAFRIPHSAFVRTPGDARAVPIVEMGNAVGPEMDGEMWGASINSRPAFGSPPLTSSQSASATVGFTPSGQALVEPGPPSPLVPTPAATRQRTTASAGLIDPGESPAAFTVHAPENPVESLIRASWVAEGGGVGTPWSMERDPAAVGLMADGARNTGPAQTAPAEPFIMRPDGIAHFGLSSSQSRSEAIDAAAPAAAPIQVDEAPRLADRLAHSIRVNWENGRSEARLALVPPDLGTVRVQVVMEHSSLSLTFTAGNEHARGLIESSLPRLRENLAGQGLDVGQMNVQVDLTERDPGRSFRAFDFDNVPPEIPQRLSTVAPFMIERPVPAISGLDLFA